MAILITGGAGYIGSHAVRYLQERNEELVVLDNLQSGHRAAVKDACFVQGDIRDPGDLDRAFASGRIEAVMHFAANSLVGESVEDPWKYYHNNVYGTLCLLEAMRRHGVDRIVFSSSAAVYGEPDRVPIPETARTDPSNPYGDTKLTMERMMRSFDAAYGLCYVSLRYFNAAGADRSGKIGEDHTPETHLIPLILQVPLGRREKISVFGTDYPTADGTCIRDYIHVTDLASAHYLALEYLRKGNDSETFNLGNGSGYSVLDVIRAARAVTGHPIPSEVQPRRLGDPAVLVASADKARRILGWTPRFDSLEQIVEDAWRWHKGHPKGYGE